MYRQEFLDKESFCRPVLLLVASPHLRCADATKQTLVKGEVFQKIDREAGHSKPRDFTKNELREMLSQCRVELEQVKAERDTAREERNTSRQELRVANETITELRDRLTELDRDQQAGYLLRRASSTRRHEEEAVERQAQIQDLSLSVKHLEEQLAQATKPELPSPKPRPSFESEYRAHAKESIRLTLRGKELRAEVESLQLRTASMEAH